MDCVQYTTDGQSAGLRGEEVIMTINMVQVFCFLIIVMSWIKE